MHQIKKTYIKTFFILFLITTLEIITRNIIIKENDLVIDIDLWETAIAIIILAPLIETLVFQHVPHIIWTKFYSLSKYNTIILISISSCFFAFTHKDDLIMLVGSFLKGFTLFSFYFEIKSLKQNAFWHTVGVHSLYNLVLFLLIMIETHM